MFDNRSVSITHRTRLPVHKANHSRLLDLLWPGDVILKWNDASITSRVITHSQERFGYAPQAPQITHVSMYTGPNEVFHATYSVMDLSAAQTRLQDFIEYYDGHQISIARPFADLGPTASVRRRLVETCRELCGQRYNMKIIAIGQLSGSMLARTFPSLNRELLRRLSSELASGQICSSALFDVFLRVSGVRGNPIKLNAGAARSPYVMPADFFAAPDLGNVTTVRLAPFRT